MKNIIALINLAALVSAVAALPQYWTYYPGYPLVRAPAPSYPLVRAPAPDFVLYGCLDQTIANVGSSIVSGVNGTFVGIGAGISGIANGTSAIIGGGATGVGSAVGGAASTGGNAIGDGIKNIGETIGGTVRGSATPSTRTSFSTSSSRA